MESLIVNCQAPAEPYTSSEGLRLCFGEKVIGHSLPAYINFPGMLVNAFQFLHTSTGNPITPFSNDIFVIFTIKLIHKVFHF